ncbi:tetraacyldisaccharide 4'-kinase [Hymenobacter rubripertinctus]|uniref:Tetraacyldisaccharide 4'-kinase n=1 Tax=Hymenobacter rubripertinctus TaxID=2029981 RepID=A0A418QU47_9BACT|nr:tetraacyldisaccharide 4'-kinase [Hymenobacter rubripertinctus]RIY08621.1 tetraacyldisaccharide 4'-kinase [Hymenobacter rubripertinctus]
MISPLQLLLLPFSWLYAAVLAVRNWLYARGWKASVAFARVPVISVGNLRVGGTGKTPHVAWLVAWLQAQGQHPALLSRGYGRRTRGYRRATATDSAATVGDEPWQQFGQFGGRVPVVVSEDRGAGIGRLLGEEPAVTAVVLDDAYQHRRVRPAVNILLSEQQRPFYQDYVLPAGRLRESRAGAGRADAVIITKCAPDLSAAARAAITARVRRYARPGVPVLFSVYEYGVPVPVPGTGASAAPEQGQAVVVLTGIVQPGPLLAHLAAAGYRVVHHARYPDHHAFTPREIGELAAQCPPGQCVLTTQKDAARLQEPALAASVADLPVFYIPITVRFLADGEARLVSLLAPHLPPPAVV